MCGKDSARPHGPLIGTNHPHDTPRARRGGPRAPQPPSDLRRPPTFAQNASKGAQGTSSCCDGAFDFFSNQSMLRGKDYVIQNHTQR